MSEGERVREGVERVRGWESGRVGGGMKGRVVVRRGRERMRVGSRREGMRMGGCQRGRSNNRSGCGHLVRYPGCVIGDHPWVCGWKGCRRERERGRHHSRNHCG